MFIPSQLFLQTLYMKIYSPAVTGIFLFPHLLIDYFPIQGNVGIAGKKQKQFIFLQSQKNLLIILHNRAGR